MADSEARFAHLLQPIRDLAQNWNIDIASELEDYLGELEKITFSFDGDSKTLNFAEAALLIQGSTCIYSKKVEYLYTLLYQTLDLLIERKNKEKAQSDTVDGEEKGVEEPEFLELDDLEEAKGIDLVEESHRSVGSTTRLPRSALALLAGIGANDINSGGLRRTDFRMNTCVMDKNGALIISQSSMDGFNIVMPSLPQQTPNMQQAPNTQKAGQGEAVVGAVAPPGREYSSDEEDDDESDDDNAPKIVGPITGMPQGKEAQVTESSATRKHTTEKATKKSSMRQRVDVWAMLDPHEDDGANKPLVKGKTYRIPSILKKPEGTQTSEVRLEGLSFVTTLPCRLRGLCFPEFRYIYNMQLKRKQHARKSAHSSSAVVDTDEEEEEYTEVPHPDFEVDEPADVSEDEDEGFANEHDVPPNMEELPTEMSYEEHCKSKLEDWLDRAHEFAQETAVSKAVNDWRSRLDPVLAKQEAHPPFDMLVYGEDLIGNMRHHAERKGATVDETSGAVKGESDLLVSFSELTLGLEQYEVARKFTAVLQLANNRNVDVVSTTKLDSLSFRLLSVKPQYDIDSYRAPSLQPNHPTTTTSTKEHEIKQKKSAQNKENIANGVGLKNGDVRNGKKVNGRKDTSEAGSPVAPPNPKRKKTNITTEEDHSSGNSNTRDTRRKRKERDEPIVAAPRRTEDAEEEEEAEFTLRGPRTRMEV